VIDANIALRALAPKGHETELLRLEEWRRAGVQIFAPDLWLAETVSALRSLVFQGVLKKDEGSQAIGNLFRLQVQVIPFDQKLYESAFLWAERLGQSKSYDACYLALSERIQKEQGGVVEFWTTDERLANRARQIGALWVNFLK
jgi:predicted nucleic acid-binding protein